MEGGRGGGGVGGRRVGWEWGGGGGLGREREGEEERWGGGEGKGKIREGEIFYVILIIHGLFNVYQSHPSHERSIASIVACCCSR